MTTDETDTIGSVSFGEVALAGTDGENDNDASSSNGGSGGCNANLSGAAFLTLATFVISKKAKK